MNEDPTVVYGRLLEAAHLGGYSVERVASAFKSLLLDDRWKTVGSGFEDIDQFLSSINLSQYRISVEDRKEIVGLLDKARATQRAAAKALGVGQATIGRDLEPNGSKVNGKANQSGIVDLVHEPNGLTFLSAPPSEVAGQFERKAETRIRLQERDDRKKAELQSVVDIESLGLIPGDFREKSKDIADDSTELIFTDPPYDRESVGLYEDAALIAARILKPGGSLIAYCGQYLLPEILPMMLKHLRFWWLNACIHEGGQMARMESYGVIVGWKPMVWFTKGARGDRQSFVSDFVGSGREKSHHEWQQAESEAAYYIEKLTAPTGLVVDFFAGGGTTCVAAQKLGRPWIAFEINPATAKKADDRIAAL